MDRAIGCIKCSAGRYQATAGSSSCATCAAGLFNNISRSRHCGSCPAGYSAEDPSGATRCIACQPGCYFCEFKYAHVMLSYCAHAGYFQDEAATATGCNPCAQGYISESQHAMMCSACPGIDFDCRCVI
jgi:hypothetical protein